MQSFLWETDRVLKHTLQIFKLSPWLPAILLLFAWSLPLAAQSLGPVGRTLTGTITDRQHEPLSGAVVQVQDQTNGSGYLLHHQRLRPIHLQAPPAQLRLQCLGHVPQAQVQGPADEPLRLQTRQDHQPHH